MPTHLSWNYTNSQRSIHIALTLVFLSFIFLTPQTESSFTFLSNDFFLFSAKWVIETSMKRKWKTLPVRVRWFNPCCCQVVEPIREWQVTIPGCNGWWWLLRQWCCFFPCTVVRTIMSTNGLGSWFPALPVAIAGLLYYCNFSCSCCMQLGPASSSSCSFKQKDRLQNEQWEKPCRRQAPLRALSDSTSMRHTATVCFPCIIAHANQVQ